MLNIENLTTEKLNDHIYTEIIKKGMSPTQFLIKGPLPIPHKLYFSNMLQMIEDLRNIYGTDIVNCRDEHGDTILHHASTISSNHYKRVVKLGADISAPNLLRVTPFHNIVSYEKPNNLPIGLSPLAIVELSSRQDIQGTTPLMTAINSKNNDMAKHIIDLILKHKDIWTEKYTRPLPLFIKDNSGNNILHHAYKVNNTDLILYIKSKFDLEAPRATDSIPLLESISPLSNTEWITLMDIQNNNKIRPKEFKNIIHGINDISNSSNPIHIENNICVICGNTPVSLCILPCSHRYCYTCLCDINISPDLSSAQLDNINCKYRCNIDSFVITPTENMEPPPIKFYMGRFYKLVKALAAVSNDKFILHNDKFYFYKGGVELECCVNASRLNITVRLLQYIPQNLDLASNIIKCILNYNKPNGNMGIGSLYINNGNIYSEINIHLDYLIFTALLSVLDRIILSVHTFSAHIAIEGLERSSDIGVSSADAILKIDLDKTTNKKITVTEILDSIKIWKPNSINGNTVKLNNNILLKISKENVYIELYKYIKHIDVGHIQTLKFIATYRPTSAIDNFRLHLDTTDGLLTIYSIVLIKSCRLLLLNENINNLEQTINHLTDKLSIFCKTIE